MARNVMVPPKDTKDLLRVQKKAHVHLDADGNECPDPVPIAPPVGYKRTKPIREQLREMVRGEALAREAKAAGAETFEESEDFDVDDDMDPRSPWEEQFEPMPGRGDSMADMVERGMTAALDRREGRVGGSTPKSPPLSSSNAEPPEGTEASRVERGDPPPEATKTTKQRS